MATDEERIADAVEAISGTLATGPTTSLTRSLPDTTPDQPLWVAIRNRAEAIGFSRYKDFIEAVLCADNEQDKEHRFLFSATIDPWVATGEPNWDTLKAEFAKNGYDVKSAKFHFERVGGKPPTFNTDVVIVEPPEDTACGRATKFRVVKQSETSANFYREYSPAEVQLRKTRKQGTAGGFHGLSAYELLKTATEVFLLLNCGVRIENAGFSETDEASRLKNWASLTFDELVTQLSDYLANGSEGLPYLKRIVSAVYPNLDEIDSPFCYGVIAMNITCPCLLELIWSYWHEEGMLVQSMNTISLRFQNKRRGTGRDPLVAVTIDPLRPLSNFLWGYIQDERHRLTVVRRAYEYDQHYGITLQGKAISNFHPADSRSKFLEGFHSLLRMTAAYYRDASDTTVEPDGFPLLNAIKEVHLELSAGAHNQFRDLPYTARVEMLMQQWLLARPEIRDFLPSRPMVPYAESWMGQVDTMKKLQGWTDTTVRHFRNLAVFGERILLSIRYGDWSDETDHNMSKNWADYWKQEIQGYIHAYRSATGVDLSADFSDAQMTEQLNTPPAAHLRKRLEEQRARA